MEQFPEQPTRELLYSELLLLQKEYMRLLQRAKPSQKRPLQDAHQSAYERLEALLNAIAPPQTTKPRRPKPPAPAVPPPGVDIGDLEGSPWALSSRMPAGPWGCASSGPKAR